MFTQAELDRLIDAMRTNSVTSLEVDSDDMSLELHLPVTAAASVTPSEPIAQKPAQQVVKSPGIGTFLPRGQDDGLDGVEPQTEISAGDTLGYIVQGVVRVPIIAPTEGRTTGPTPSEGAIFGYGDVVFNLEVTS